MPAGQGNYEERKVYKLDLIEDDMQESSYRLGRYLSFSEVRNGNAFKNAHEDYEKVCKEREVEKTIPNPPFELTRCSIFCFSLVQRINGINGLRSEF